MCSLECIMMDWESYCDLLEGPGSGCPGCSGEPGDFCSVECERAYVEELRIRELELYEASKEHKDKVDRMWERYDVAKNKME